MNFKTLLEIFSEIKQIIDVNPVSTNIGIITNEFTGESYLIEKIASHYENKSKTKVIIIEGNDLESLESFQHILSSIFREDFGQDNSTKLTNNSYADLLLSFLTLLYSFKTENLIFIVNHIERLSSEKQYTISSQFRNVREKLKIQKNSTKCHFLILGCFSYFDQVRFCQKYGTSFTLDDVFYFSNSNRTEQNLILQDMGIRIVNKQNVVDVIQDICGGAIGLLLLITNMSLPVDINEILKIVSNDSNINFIIKNALENKNSKMIELIINIIEKKQISIKFSEDLERMYLSGLVNVKPLKDSYIVNIESWLLEVQTKKIISKDKREYSSYDQHLPLYISLNLQAYSIMMEVENYLRNILISKLSRLKYDKHPFAILDCFGEVKSTTEGKAYTYYNWCKHKLYQHRNTYNVDLFESLSSQLDLVDLENIFISDIVPNKYSEESFIKLLNGSRPREELVQLFKRLKQIRNPIAHNQFINFSVLNELKEIKADLLLKNN